MGSRTGRDPIILSTGGDDQDNIRIADAGANVTMDLLEQQQAREQARLLHRFRELRQWQQKQQDQLMHQQQLQLEVLREEQLRVQMLIASQRGAQWGDGRVTKPEGLHKPSTLLMTPPHRTGRGVGTELAKAIMTISADSGLVASLGDTLEKPKDSLPKPVMYPVSPSSDDDKYTNPELFSNPASEGDDLQSLDERCRYLDQADVGSDASSDSFILPPVPPDPKLARLASLGQGGNNLMASLSTLQALLNSAEPNILQQVLGLMPKEQQVLFHECQQAVVEESASPSFSPVNNAGISQPLTRASNTAISIMDQTCLSSKPTSQPQPVPQMQAQQVQPLLSDRHPFHELHPEDQRVPADRVESWSGQDNAVSQRHVLGLEGQGQDSARHRQDLVQASVSVQRPRDHSPLWQHQKNSWQPQQQLPQVAAQRLCQDGGVEKEEEEKDCQHEESDDGELEVTVRAAGSPDDRPIRPGLQGRKTFEQLLEEQMATEQQTELRKEEKVEIQEEQGPTKRPFLRKGEGTARFLKPVKRPPPKKSSSGNQAQRANVTNRPSQPGPGNDREKVLQQRKMLPRKQSDKKQLNSIKEAKKDSEDKPLPEMLKLIKRRSEGGKRVQGNARTDSGQKISDSTPHAGADAEDVDMIPDDASFIARLRERQIAEPAEVEELEEFELLEDVADNMSLVSNSSVMARLVTPNKQRQKNAVTSLKNYLDQKKMVTSSPFERNAAMRSLMAANSLHMSGGQAGDVRTIEKDSFTKQDKENKGCMRSESDSSCDTLTESSSDEETENKGVPVTKTKRGDNDRKASGVNGFSHGVLLGTQDQANGLLFSSKFSFLAQDKKHSPDSEDKEPKSSVSPTKSVTRKVATLQSRLAAANDTATLLQKLSVHAGFLSSKFAAEPKGHHAQEADFDTSQHDVSGISSTIPQPLLIETRSCLGTDGVRNRTRRPDEGDVLAGLEDGMADEEDCDRAKNKERRNNIGDDLESSDDEDDDCVEGGHGDAPQMRSGVEDLHEIGIASAAVNVNQNNSNVVYVEDKERSNTADVDQHKYSAADLNQNNSNIAEFDDEEEWTCSAPQASYSALATTDSATNSLTPPTSKLMSRLFPSLKPKVTKMQQQQQQQLQMATSTTIGDGVQSKLLREKLLELEAEIERFRSENAALERLRREREDGLSKLKEEIVRFDREKTEELKRLEEFKVQETKKLKQDRKLFETYQKQVRAMPDKKEREEIDMLRTQLSELQEELKRKENRWTSSVSRLKVRISELETENGELREEIKILERKRLQWVQMQGTKNVQVPQQKPHRSSTPTEIGSTTMMNGCQDAIIPSTQALKAKGPVTTSNPTSSSASDVAIGAVGGKASSVPVPQGFLGESMPRGQPATLSMIEGINLASVTAQQGEGTDNVGRQGRLPPAAERSLADNLGRQSRLPPAAERPGVDKGNRQYEETQYPDGKVERVYSNGSREVLFANGTRKEISSDGQYIIVSFFNGDIKQIFPDQRVVYYYAEAQTTHTTYPDKLEVLQFPNNQIEKHYPDGTKEIIFPDQTVKYLFPNGTEESIFQDGTIMRIDKNGERILEFPNGQREIHTEHYKRREYPDGTVKTLHNDGRQETRYSNGRVRLKDKDGNILLDRMY